jgi:hypothetical protein
MGTGRRTAKATEQGTVKEIKKEKEGCSKQEQKERQ